ncbi:CYTH domain-containing protein [Shewanella sp. A32]|uniref:CYTH domain-containing protein n=1 Tax=Shewanella sp. A32 TaxID=3031327 RepID=UPI0023B89C58|nr:CYTH and CHAD domain-containing protein [Shewanella sp. A32]MDF0533134.1 CYTH domain-containing protein [Shewanella sp. A32]
MEHDSNHTEIELKLFILPQYKALLTHYLDQLPGSDAKGCRQLSNSYFDTPRLALRQLDMGLRVRGCDGKYEQTIKTAGRVIGGLHSRPEYNVDISGTHPELALFPADIWPATQDISVLQQQLRCLFSTDFQRCRWMITEGQSLIEVALDQGTIAANGDSEPLCEVEFELISGVTADLLPLAQKVAQQVPVRLGKASKAQRGYRLANQSSPLALEALQFIQLPAGGDINASLITVLETALERWQLLEDMIQQSLTDTIQQPALWQRLRACIRLLRLTLTQFGLHSEITLKDFQWLEQQLAFIDEGRYLACLCSDRAQLNELPQLATIKAAAQQTLQRMDFEQQLQSLWQDNRYGELQLALVRLLIELQGSEVLLDVGDNLQQLSDRLQETSWQQLLSAMPEALSTAAYLALANTLDEAILVGLAFGSLYPEKARDQFRAPWQDLSDGIVILGAYHCAEQLVPDAAEALAVKQQSLRFAMEHSRLAALQKIPYWR